MCIYMYSKKPKRTPAEMHMIEFVNYSYVQAENRRSLAGWHQFIWLFCLLRLVGACLVCRFSFVLCEVFSVCHISAFRVRYVQSDRPLRGVGTARPVGPLGTWRPRIGACKGLIRAPNGGGPEEGALSFGVPMGA